MDVSVLVHAHRRDASEHARYRAWVEDVANSDSAYGVSDLVLSRFVRVVTHPGIFRDFSPMEAALTFARALRERANAVSISPGERHWEIFARLCREFGTKGNMVSDAYFAAIAIEAGAEWITTDRDYARFSGLKWRHPFD